MFDLFPSKQTLRLQKLGIWLLVLCGLWMLQLSTSSAFTAKERAAIEQSKKIHAKGHYPSDLPQAKIDKETPLPKSGCSSGSLKPIGFSSSAASCFRIAPYILIGMVAVLLLLVLWSSVRSVQWKEKEPILEAEQVPEILGRRLEADMSLEDFLASEDWEGAICSMLLDTMRLVGWKPVGQGVSQTPRELFATLPQDTSFYPPLFRLLRLAEDVRFGGRKADKELFSQGQKAFTDFKSAYLNWKQSVPSESNVE